MLNDSAIEAFNTRFKANVNTIKTLPVSKLDALKALGSEAEALLLNRNFALAIHTTKFNITDAISDIGSHSADDNSKRIALTNQLAGLDALVNTLKESVYLKNKIVEHQNKPRE